MAPDADALVGGRLPGGFIDDDRVPTEFPFETRRRHRIEGQFLIVGVLTDRHGDAESEFLHALIRGDHVVKLGDLNVAVLDAGSVRIHRQRVD